MAIRRGQGHLVAKILAPVLLARIPRELRFSFANVCRRAQLLQLGMRILTPAIRAHEENRHDPPPTPQELAEYSVLLIRFGAVKEALQTLELSTAPEANLYKAFAHFNRWDYAKALPVLKDYLSSDLVPYSRLVGQVNLAASHVALKQWPEALDLLRENIRLARNYARLRANCHELRAQVFVAQNQDRKARGELSKAAHLIGSENSFDELFIRKWLAILEAKKTNSTESLVTFRAEADARRDSESVREADFYVLKTKFDTGIFDHLFFGTPFTAYRQRLETEFGRRPEHYVFGVGSKTATSWFDLRSAAGSEGHALQAGNKIHQVLSLLLRDFYRPIRVGSIFADLFPGERFDVFSSANRVHQTVYRCRNWLKDAGIPAQIDELGGAFKLRVSGDYQFVVSNSSSAGEELSKIDMFSERLLATFSRGFTTDEAVSCLNISVKTFRDYVGQTSSRGELEIRGKGRGTRYILKAIA